MKVEITINLEITDEKYKDLSFDKPVDLSELLKGRKGFITEASSVREPIFGHSADPVAHRYAHYRVTIKA